MTVVVSNVEKQDMDGDTRQNAEHMSYELGVFAANVATGRVVVQAPFNLSEWFAYVAVLPVVLDNFVDGFRAEIENIERDIMQTPTIQKELLESLLAQWDGETTQNILRVLCENETLKPVSSEGL